MGTTVVAAPVRADQAAYFPNVTLRAGHYFANADDAVGSGDGICDKVASGGPYGQIVSEVEADFATIDEYQAFYLVSQAENELRPAQLRNSAAGYRPLRP